MQPEEQQRRTGMSAGRALMAAGRGRGRAPPARNEAQIDLVPTERPLPEYSRANYRGRRRIASVVCLKVSSRLKKKTQEQETTPGSAEDSKRSEEGPQNVSTPGLFNSGLQAPDFQELCPSPENMVCSKCGRRDVSSQKCKCRQCDRCHSWNSTDV